MNSIDLTKPLRKYKSGWVAIDKRNKVVAYAKTFALINKKSRTMKDVVLVPVVKSYFGFVTIVDEVSIL